MKFQYELRKSVRKTLAIEITKDGFVIVRAPVRCPQSVIDTFLQEKQDWILEKVEMQKKREEAVQREILILTGG